MEPLQEEVFHMKLPKKFSIQTICLKQKTLLIEQVENLFYDNVLLSLKDNFKGKTMDDLYKPSDKIVENAHIDKAKYK